MTARGRWVGIDEAGYGPNLGPMVMTAVVAEGPASPAMDLWADLSRTISRDRDEPGKLRVDDSKRLNQGRLGRWRLESAALAAIEAAQGEAPTCLSNWLSAVGAGSLREVELDHWLEIEDEHALASSETSIIELPAQPFEGARWRLNAVRSVVVGPRRFNQGIADGGSKSRVHFEAFAELLSWAWETTTAGVVTTVRVDKHGGRHFYYEPLCQSMPGAWVDRGEEGPSASCYQLRDAERLLRLSFLPKADSEDGLVALASVLSKALRERWMDVFNRFWLNRCPGIRPTAGYPVDALRFRKEIEPTAREMGIAPELWWRLK